MKLLRTLQLLITYDSAGKECAFKPRTEDRADDSDVETDPPFSEHNSGHLTVAEEGWENIPFGGVTTARFIYIETDIELTLSINGGADIKLTPGEDDTAVFYMESDDITSLALSNASEEAPASVVFCVAGV